MSCDVIVRQSVVHRERALLLTQLGTVQYMCCSVPQPPIRIDQQDKDAGFRQFVSDCTLHC